MIDYSHFLEFVEQSSLRSWRADVEGDISRGLCTQRYGDLPQWYAALAELPDCIPSQLSLDTHFQIGHAEDLTAAQRQKILACFQALIPWRKGPIQLFDIFIDTEWRSDWKWDRVIPHLSPLKNKTILDVGCGNGYHCWRMLGEHASRVVGVDPSPRFVVQFYMCKHFADLHAGANGKGSLPIDVLPLGLEALPSNLQAFDTVFSMGVLYHRRSPFDHLRELKDALKPGGELVLETLLVEGGLDTCLVPEGRYAKMNNVWCLPSSASLESWLRKCGFTDVHCVDLNRTSLEEQRATPWMRFQSLKDFLDPLDQSKTVEGHPSPLRGVFIAKKPR